MQHWDIYGRGQYKTEADEALLATVYSAGMVNLIWAELEKHYSHLRVAQRTARRSSNKQGAK